MADLGIAIVGAGAIVEAAHLPAYAKHGLRVLGLYDIVTERAEKVARQSGLSTYGSIDDILADPNVDVVDLAITPQAQPEVARRALDAGKHVLCQKPLAPRLAEARALVEYAEAAGRLLAVNQQMRWEPAIATSKQLLDAGVLGSPIYAEIHTNLNYVFPASHWLSQEPRFMASYGAIHFLDSARHLFGMPTKLTAKLLNDPRQECVGETWINLWVEWADGPTLVVFERYNNRAADEVATFRLEGTAGAVRASIGIYMDYPVPTLPDRIESQRYQDGVWKFESDDQYWLPDAFARPMLGLLAAIESGGAPPTSGRDNLLTLSLVESVYLSSRLQRTILMSEVDELLAKEA